MTVYRIEFQLGKSPFPLHENRSHEAICSIPANKRGEIVLTVRCSGRDEEDGRACVAPTTTNHPQPSQLARVLGGLTYEKPLGDRPLLKRKSTRLCSSEERE